MKWLVLWILTLAVILAGTLVIWVLYTLYVAIISRPDLYWVPILVFAAILVATIVAAIDYLTERRPPRTPKT